MSDASTGDRLLILGANGPTGRQTVRQALDRGHRVAALTRHPQAFPIQHPHLDVIAGDATSPSVIDPAVAGTDAVICTIGTSFTRKPVDVYSASSRLVVAAMRRHRRRRLLVVTSSGVNPAHGRAGVANKLSYTVMRRYFGPREDLAAMLLDQLGDGRFLRKVAAVATPDLHVSAVEMFRREMLKRRPGPAPARSTPRR